MCRLFFLFISLRVCKHAVFLHGFYFICWEINGPARSGRDFAWKNESLVRETRRSRRAIVQMRDVSVFLGLEVGTIMEYFVVGFLRAY